MMETAYQGLKALAMIVRPLGGQFHSSSAFCTGCFTLRPEGARRLPGTLSPWNSGLSSFLFPFRPEGERTSASHRDALKDCGKG
jgi:hypothetical protein